MTRWVLGSFAGALASAPLAFGGLTSSALETAARSVSVGLFGSALVFLALGFRWGKRWAV
ncbi:MAG: hypothetical protein ABIR59_00805 [Gemmatimonadales bacterium]